MPFEVPENWLWCRGISCFKGMESKKPYGEYFSYIDIESINNKKQIIESLKILSVNEAPSRASRAVESGSVLFSLVRPYLKNIAYVEEKNKDSIASTGFYVCNSNGIFYSRYLYYLMVSDYVVGGLNDFMKGDNSPSISKNDIEQWLYPIPPFAEQQCITAKIKALFDMLNRIEKALIE